MQTKQLSQKLHSLISGLSLKKIARLACFRGVGVLLQMLMQFAIARIAGPAGLAVMQLYQTWSCVLGEAVAMGLPTETMKSISTTQYRLAIKSRLNRRIGMITKCWLIGVLLLVLFSLLPLGSHLREYLPFSLAGQMALLWSVLCFAILRLTAEALKAMDGAGQAVFAENNLFPLAMLGYCSCIALGFLVPGGNSEGKLVSHDALIFVATLFLSLSSLYSFFRAYARIETIQLDLLSDVELNAADPSKTDRLKIDQTVFSGEDSLLTPETLYFWGSAVVNIGFLFLPFLLMPYFGSFIGIGLFTLAFKLMNPITTILGMLNALFGPRFAKAADTNLFLNSTIQKDKNQKNSRILSTLLIQSQILSLALYLPFLIPVLIFAEPVLGLFGKEFIAAKPYLYILAAAQLCNAMTGLSGNMLNMVGMGKREFQGAVLFFAVGLISGIFCGQLYGLMGVAITYSLALAGKNIWSYSFARAYIVKQSLGKASLSVSTLSVNISPRPQQANFKMKTE